MFAGLEAGVHSVLLADVPSNCTVQGPNPRDVSVTAGTTIQVAFTAACAATTGSLEIAAVTTGEALDLDGYTVTLDGGTSQPLAINSVVTFSDLAAGSHEVTLTNVAENCTVVDDNPTTVSVVAWETVRTVFEVTCRLTTLRNQIVFSFSGLYRMEEDGSNVVGIYHSGTWPAVSPDGRELLFQFQGEIWRVGADGSEPTLVVSVASFPGSSCENGWCSLGDPAWSPDGQMLAFARSADGGDLQSIWVASADGTGLRQLGWEDEDDKFALAWSPNGDIIAYTLCWDLSGLCIIEGLRLDGSAAFWIEPPGFREGLCDVAMAPAWSADGTKIAYAAVDCYGGKEEILVVDYPSLAEPIQVTDLSTLGWVERLSWSPDDSKIVFDAGAGIYVVDLERSNITQIRSSGKHPDWSP